MICDDWIGNRTDAEGKLVRIASTQHALCEVLRALKAVQLPYRRVQGEDQVRLRDEPQQDIWCRVDIVGERDAQYVIAGHQTIYTVECAIMSQTQDRPQQKQLDAGLQKRLDKTRELRKFITDTPWYRYGSYEVDRGYIDADDDTGDLSSIVSPGAWAHVVRWELTEHPTGMPPPPKPEN